VGGVAVLPHRGTASHPVADSLASARSAGRAAVSVRRDPGPGRGPSGQSSRTIQRL